jgi:hypothetical protein
LLLLLLLLLLLPSPPPPPPLQGLMLMLFGFSPLVNLTF